jgi:carbamoyltransferase
MILGVSFGYHDSAAAIIDDTKIIATSLEERFSRIKHDSSFPSQAIEFCLKEAGITIEEVEKIVYYEDILIKFDRILEDIENKEERIKEKIIPNYLGKLDIKKYIASKLEVSEDKVTYISHHTAHASAAFLSPFDNCGVLVIDGVGERESITIWKKEKNRLEKLYNVNFPHSIGLLYSVFTAFLGFEVNEGEYKVMGLAAYGEPIYKEKIYKLINKIEPLELNMKYFDFYSTNYPFNKDFIELFGKPKDSSEYDLKNDKYYANLAASLQIVTEELIFSYIDKTIKLTNEKNIVYCGGVALNSVANTKIKEKFDISLFIPPDPGDGGSALYATLFYQKVKNKIATSYRLNTPFLGKKFNSTEILKDIEKNFEGKYKKFSRDEFLKRVANALYDGKVIGWFWDKFEFGPRALGHRSIIANPAYPNMKNIINKKIKYREEFRPFAPSVLEGFETEFFEVKENNEWDIENYMLGVVKVKKPDLIPAVTHQNSARIQVVRKNNNSFYYQLIKEFYRISSIPMILNTSFNLKGEPIVSSPKEAILTFSYSDMDMVAIYPYILYKE